MSYKFHDDSPDALYDAAEAPEELTVSNRIENISKTMMIGKHHFDPYGHKALDFLLWLNSDFLVRSRVSAQPFSYISNKTKVILIPLVVRGETRKALEFPSTKEMLEILKLHPSLRNISRATGITEEYMDKVFFDYLKSKIR